MTNLLLMIGATRSFLNASSPLAMMALLVVLTGASGHAAAVDDPPGSNSVKSDETSKTPLKPEETKETKDAKPSGSKPSRLAIIHADIETVTNGTIRRGVVLIKDGKIEKVGRNVEVPADAKIIDAAGRIITPGFVAMNVARVGIGAVNTQNRQSKLADSLDPFDRQQKFCLGVGITSGCVQLVGGFGFRFGRFWSGQDLMTPEEAEFYGLLHDETHDHAPGDPVCAVCAATSYTRPDIAAIMGTGPSAVGFGLPTIPGLVQSYDHADFPHDHAATADSHSGHEVVDHGHASEEDPLEPFPIPGANQDARPLAHAVLKFCYGELNGMLVKENPFYYLPASALATPLQRYQWRRNLAKAKEYLQTVESYEKSGKKGPAPRRTVGEEFVKLVKKETPLRISASKVDQIRDMIALAQEWDYDLILEDVHEAWVIANEISRAKVRVIFTPRSLINPEKDREKSTGSNPLISGLLEKAGVPFALGTLGNSISTVGLAGRDLTSLPIEAAFAVRGGASEATALAALTIVPARMLGIDDRVGSIEEGKDADLLILDGPPLDYRTYVETAIVNGKVRYERAKDRVYPVFPRP